MDLKLSISITRFHLITMYLFFPYSDVHIISASPLLNTLIDIKLEVYFLTLNCTVPWSSFPFKSNSLGHYRANHSIQLYGRGAKKLVNNIALYVMEKKENECLRVEVSLIDFQINIVIKIFHKYWRLVSVETTIKCKPPFVKTYNIYGKSVLPRSIYV